MWLHADAAYGGGLLISHRSKALLDGIAECDSITIDPHKWFYAPVDAGAVLVRDASRLTESFGLRPAYLTDGFDDGSRYQYYVHGLEQSRRFRALKVWMSFKRYGTEQIGRWIDANVEQARSLWELVREHKRFEAALRPPMSAICIRWVDPDLDAEHSARLHRHVVRRIEAGGRFWISSTVLKGRSWFRINPVNFRTRKEHMRELLEALENECANAQLPSAGGGA
jgi:glutamate/tyrosine decarboxylase-like PLP-dependent enzyme